MTEPTDRTIEDIAGALTGFEPGPERFAGLFQALAAGLDGEGPMPVRLEEARESLGLASAIYFSSATGEGVDLPIGPDHPTYRGWLPWTAG